MCSEIKRRIGVGLWILSLVVPHILNAADEIRLIPQIGHAGIITSAVISPDGKYVVSTGWDNTVRFWELETGNLIYILKFDWSIHSQGSVRGMFFSPDGKTLALCDQSKIRFFDLDTWKMRKQEPGGQSVNFSSDWKYLATCGGNKLEVRGPDIEGGKWNVTLKSIKITFRRTNINCAAFTPDNRWVAIGMTSDPDGFSVRVYNTLTGEMKYGCGGHSHLTTSLSFSPDGKYLATTSRDASTIVWDAETGGKVEKLMRRKDFLRWNWVNWVSFTPDGKYMLTGTEAAAPNIVVWKVGSWENLYEFDVLDAASAPSGRVSFNRDGSLMVGSLCDGIAVWDFKDRKLIKTFGMHVNGLTSVKFSHDGRFLACGSALGMIYILDRDLLKMEILKGRSACVNSVDCSSRNSLLVSGGRDGVIDLYRFVDKGRQLQDTLHEMSNIHIVRFSPDSRYLAWGTGGGITRLIEIERDNSGKFKFRRASTKSFEVGSGVGSYPVENLVFTRDGRKIIDIPTSTESSGELRIWDVKTRRLIKKFKTGTNTLALDISPDNNLLAWGGRWGESHGAIYDLKGETTTTKFGEWSFISSLRFSPSGKLLVRGNVWGNIGVIDSRTGKEITSLTQDGLSFGHDYIVWSVDFSPDEKLLTSCSTDGTLRLWRIDPEILNMAASQQEAVQEVKAKQLARLVVTFVFPEPEEFIAYTEDNRFWSGPSAEKYVRFNKGRRSYSVEEYTQLSGRKNDPQQVKILLKED